MPTQRFPMLDEELPHQIVLMHHGVSCNCRRVRKHAKGGFPIYETFAELGPADDVLAAYYDPANHKGLRHVA